MTSSIGRPMISASPQHGWLPHPVTPQLASLTGHRRESESALNRGSAHPYLHPYALLELGKELLARRTYSCWRADLSASVGTHRSPSAERLLTTTESRSPGSIDRPPTSRPIGALMRLPSLQTTTIRTRMEQEASRRSPQRLPPSPSGEHIDPRVRSHSGSAVTQWNALDSPGHIHEVLAGNFYHEQTESVPEQTWSSAGLLDATARGLLGLEIDGIANRLRFAPHVPAE